MIRTGQLGILNSLVTFAAENVPGGLNGEEREVAQIVGRMALNEGVHIQTLLGAYLVESVAHRDISLPEHQAHRQEVIFP